MQEGLLLHVGRCRPLAPPSHVCHRRNGDDFVEVTFASGQTERIFTKDMNIGDILAKIDNVAEDMDMQEVRMGLLGATPAHGFPLHVWHAL